VRRGQHRAAPARNAAVRNAARLACRRSRR